MVIRMNISMVIFSYMNISMVINLKIFLYSYPLMARSGGGGGGGGGGWGWGWPSHGWGHHGNDQNLDLYSLLGGLSFASLLGATIVFLARRNSKLEIVFFIGV